MTMGTFSVDVASIRRIGHDEAMSIAAVENAKLAKALRGLDADDWAKRTDCTRWDVKGLVAHLVGSAAAQASPREFLRQVRAGRPVVAEIGAQYWWDGMNEVQVRERAALSADELIAAWDETSARALRARAKLPRLIARLPLLRLPAPVGRQPLAYLFDVGFTRDIWMHRIDLAEATGKPFDADPEHDGRIVSDLVAEWAATHGAPFTLSLHGPAGGIFTCGDGGEHVDMDAVQFCRVLAERRPGEGLLAHPLPL
jgi:uncharacterized protein (TIGR03083 family)